MGETFALLNAITWAFAAVLYRKAGDYVPPAALNLFKNCVGFTLCAVALLLVNGRSMPEASTEEWALLLASGALGTAIADILFFATLNLLGAGRTAIVDCLYSPFVVLFSYLFWGEHLAVLAVIGAVLILGSVALTASREGASDIRRDRLIRGVSFGAASMAIMAFAIVSVKPLLERYDILWTSTVRLAGALPTSIALLYLDPRKLRLRDALRPRREWRFALPAAILGNFVAMLFWIGGFKFTTGGIASLLNQSSTILIVLLAALFLDERLTRLKAAAVLVALVGSGLVLI